MPPKDFFADYLNWERKQEQKREQERIAKIAGDALTKAYRNDGKQRRVGAITAKQLQDFQTDDILLGT